MATKKKQTKKNLEAKIRQLESKLSQLSAQVAPKPAETKAPPPPPKPAETKAPPPKPAETKAAPPATLETLVERVSVGVWHERKTKTPAYVPENPRAWARRHAEGADAPSQSWSLQKATITGYTAPSNKYFATRQRMAFHPHSPDKNFLGYGISLGHGAAQTQTQSPPPQSQSLPKETASSTGSGKSRQELLADYEKDYLVRLEVQYQDAEKEASEAAKAEAAEAQAQPSKSQGALPKGFTPQPAS